MSDRALRDHSHRPAHLQALEAESIHILREVAAQAATPVLLYSIGKDSSVLLHLARKAFYPSPAALPAAAYRYDVEIPRHDNVSATQRRRAMGSICAATPTPKGCARTSIRSTMTAASTRR